jgi:hypothetical protein
VNEPVKYRKYVVYVGVGPSYFFNNVVSFKDDVNSFNYAIPFRVMWEPKGSAVSLGIESGFYQLYTADISNPKAKVVNTAIPIQLVVSLKFLKTWYTNFSLGQSILFNNVHAPDYGGDFNAHKLSLADLALTLGYRFVTKTRVSYAAETKFFFSSYNNDKTLSLFFVIGYRL